MRREIRFILNGEVCRLAPSDPTRTVLQYLREDLGRCGTKEGCAEGDCGACTVVIADRQGSALRYRAVNSCIQFLPTLDGKQLITVEDLKHEGRLHPVQQAMVDCHGSQCGFCTPGFVMSLFALYHQGGSADRMTIDNALAGNLCRCTGYGPIIEAARQACGGKPDDQFVAGRDRTLAMLDDLAPTESVALEDRYFAPVSLEEAVQLRSEHPEATLVAGATDVGLWVTKQHRHLAPLIYLGNVAELKRIGQVDDCIEIGAAVTYAEAWPVLAEHYPDFGEMIRRLGATQVWNSGTLGGNVANGSPIGDSPPPLIAAGARLQLRGPQGARVLPLEDFFIDYGKQDLQDGELVEKILVPLPDPESRLYCYKISKRFDQDISAVCAAFSLQLDAQDRVASFRAAYGGMAATPKRAEHLERALVGQTWAESTVETAITALADDFQPIDDLRASAFYRLKVAGNLVRKLWLESAPDTTGPTRLFGVSEFAYGQR